MEELRAGNGFGTNPHLFFPVAHGIGVGSAPLVASANEVMGQIGMILQESNLVLGIVICPGIGCLLDLHQALCQVCFHFLVVALVLGEFAVLVHQVVGNHVELQLLILGVQNQMIPLALLGQGGAGGIDEGDDADAVCLDLVDQLNHFLGIAGNSGVNHNRLAGQALVAGGQIFCCVFDVHGQAGLAAHVNFNLHGGGIGAADADEIDVVKAFFPDLIDDLLDLGTQCQCTVDGVDIALLIEVAQACTLGLCPGFSFVNHRKILLLSKRAARKTA